MRSPKTFSPPGGSPATARGRPKWRTTLPPSNASSLAGRLAVCKSYRDVCAAENVDVIIDATGNPNVGAQVALATIAAGKHIVMMNVEADVTIGAYLAAKADEAGVVYTLGAGDEPSSTMELVNFLRGLGYPIVAAGKGKNNAFRIDATPDAYVAEATRRNMNPADAGRVRRRLENDGGDGGARQRHRSRPPTCPGMHGPAAPVDSLHKVFCPREEGGPAFAQGGRRFHRRPRRRARRVRGRRDTPSAAARAHERPASSARALTTRSTGPIT
jgi:hypothetical protein